MRVAVLVGPEATGENLEGVDKGDGAWAGADDGQSTTAWIMALPPAEATELGRLLGQGLSLAEAQLNLGNVLDELGRSDEALAAYAALLGAEFHTPPTVLVDGQAVASTPGVAPPIERVSRTARFSRVTRWSRRSKRYTPRTSC